MNRLEQTFHTLQQENRKALIPYISAGDPEPSETAEIMQALVAGGANVLELGIPFSDPAADGETICQANERALARGVTFAQTLTIVEQFRQNNANTPVVLMGYLNSFERVGFPQAMKKVADAGADAVILVDCPLEALPDYEQDLQTILPILLLAPTTNPARRTKILKKARGFIYFVSLKGVTGTQLASAEAIKADITAIKAETATPVCVGFGIRDGKTAHEMGQLADGVVIGSALVAKLHEAATKGEDLAVTAKAFITNIRQHLDAKED